MLNRHSLARNESDLFYVLPDTEVEIEPAQRAVPRELSALHALFRAQFTAILDDRDPASVVVGHSVWAEKTKGSVSGGGDARGEAGA